MSKGTQRKGCSGHRRLARHWRGNCQPLAEDGADVAISYAARADKAEAVVKELRKKGVRAEAFQADQAETKEVEALVKSVVESFGRLDILVNNAGVFASGQVHRAK